MGDALDEHRLDRLIDAGRSLLAHLGTEALLDRLLETACELTGARYAAIGVLADRRRELERFITKGIDAETREAIGDLPRGRGILGVLIDDPKPLRLADIGDHPSSYGFPAGHPPMHSFLGVPIVIRGQAWGNLYLTEKPDGGFDAADEQTAVVLADWAAIAIENARLLETAEARRESLERAVRGLEATQAIALAVGAETDLSRILELVVKRGRALVEARSVVILLREGDELVVVAGAGHAIVDTDLRIPVDASTSGAVMASKQPLRVADVTTQLRISPERLGVTDATSALLVPLIYRRRALGVLVAFDRTVETEMFTDEDEQVLRSFAASAATAVATAQTVQEDRLRDSLEAAEAERRRWARELHDETLQALGGLRVLLSSALRRGDASYTREALTQAMEQIEQEIDNLRAIITELRPAALDELGLRPAIEALVARDSSVHGLQIDCELDLPEPDSNDRRLAPELETTVYRMIQEALTNVVRHAEATTATVEVEARDTEILAAVTDDGRGFDQSASPGGFGLTGIRERVALGGGTLEISSSASGTRIAATLPLRFAEPD